MASGVLVTQEVEIRKWSWVIMSMLSHCQEQLLPLE